MGWGVGILDPGYWFLDAGFFGLVAMWCFVGKSYVDMRHVGTSPVGINRMLAPSKYVWHHSLWAAQARGGKPYACAIQSHVSVGTSPVGINKMLAPSNIQKPETRIPLPTAAIPIALTAIRLKAGSER